MGEAFSPMSVAITLEDEIDISRGDMLAKPNNVPRATQDLEVMLCWFHEKPLNPNGRYFLKHTTRDCKAIVKEVRYKIDINTLHKNEKDLRIGMNEIGSRAFADDGAAFCRFVRDESQYRRGDPDR